MTGAPSALVLDASALATALLDPSLDGSALRRRLAGSVCHAPHLVDAEVGHVLHRRALRGDIAADDAAGLLEAGHVLVDERHEMDGVLSAAAWSMRENLSFYDALYVALAAALDVPLVTADERLRRAPGLPCRTEPAVGAPTP